MIFHRWKEIYLRNLKMIITKMQVSSLLECGVGNGLIALGCRNSDVFSTITKSLLSVNTIKDVSFPKS